MMLLKRESIAVAMAMALPVAVRAAPQQPASAPTRPPSLILITVDALRADHLGVYGYSRPTSPSIDGFATEAVVISHAISQAPYTKASIGSIMSGLFPTAHKAYTTRPSVASLMAGRKPQSAQPMTDVLAPEIQTLAETLQKAGYSTVGLTTNPYLIEQFGFAQGFDRFQFLSDATSFAQADRVLDAALQALSSETTKPVFLWAHLMEPHSPYTPREPYRSMFPPLAPPRPIDPSYIPNWIRTNGSTDLNLYVALYDAEIRTVDAAFGRFYEQLRSSGLLERSVLVLTADHGESFMEHGAMEHNTGLYDELIHIPLIVRAPHLTPAHIQGQAQLVDLYPTFAHFAGIAPPRNLHGQDLTLMLEGQSRGEPFTFSELVGRQYAVRSLTSKYIAAVGKREFYELDRDPGEHDNAADRRSQVTRRLEHVLMRILALAIEAGRSVPGRAAPVSPEVLERLRSLGYLER